MSWSQRKKLRDTGKRSRWRDGGEGKRWENDGGRKGDKRGDAYSETERHERKLRKMGW